MTHSSSSRKHSFPPQSSKCQTPPNCSLSWPMPPLLPLVNGDLHPCSYHSATFSLVEWNYDIYDRKLLAVIQALKEWHHYLTGTEHPVTIITDHMNLGYFQQPQISWDNKPTGCCSCKTLRSNGWWSKESIWDQQMSYQGKTRWTLTLTIKKSLCSIKEDDWYHHIHVIDSALAEKIALSSLLDPIISKALTTVNEENREPWIPHTRKSDWESLTGLCTSNTGSMSWSLL